MKNYRFFIQFIFFIFLLINLFIRKIGSTFAGAIEEGFFASKIELYRGVEQW